MNKHIEILINELIDSETTQQIQLLISGVKNGNLEAIQTLQNVLGTIPKRPLYYIDHHISCLPEHSTRDIMRYCGDYIDQLVRFTLEDKKYFSKFFSIPLGAKADKLKKFIDKELYSNIKDFNVVYTQAKHDFNHNADVSKFNVTDVVNYIFITKILAEKIVVLSESARDYNNQGNTAYLYNPIE